MAVMSRTARSSSARVQRRRYCCNPAPLNDFSPGRLSRQGPAVLRWAVYEAGKVHARAGALVRALQRLGASRVAIVAPYLKPLTDMVVRYLAGYTRAARHWHGGPGRGERADRDPIGHVAVLGPGLLGVTLAVGDPLPDHVLQRLQEQERVRRLDQVRAAHPAELVQRDQTLHLGQREFLRRIGLCVQPEPDHLGGPSCVCVEVMRVIPAAVRLIYLRAAREHPLDVVGDYGQPRLKRGARIEVQLQLASQG
jgi:hypothetical protein